jgi:enediyne biosynthesis protein E4
LPDIVVGNYGLNSKLTASAKYPLQLYVADIDNNGTKDQIVSIANEGNYYPFVSKEYLEKQLPYLKKEYLSYTKMAGFTTKEIFGKKLAKATMFQVDTLGSYWLKNNGGNNFTIQALNKEMQWSPIMSSYYHNNTLTIAGNFYGVLPYEGRYDATTLFSQNFSTNTILSTYYNTATGEGRKILPISIKGKQCILLVRNNDRPKFFQIN